MAVNFFIPRTQFSKKYKIDLIAFLALLSTKIKILENQVFFLSEISSDNCMPRPKPTHRPEKKFSNC